MAGTCQMDPTGQLKESLCTVMGEEGSHRMHLIFFIITSKMSSEEAANHILMCCSVQLKELNTFSWQWIYA